MDVAQTTTNSGVEVMLPISSQIDGDLSCTRVEIKAGERPRTIEIQIDIAGSAFNVETGQGQCA